MCTIHNLRAWQSDAVQSRLVDADESTTDYGLTNRLPQKRDGAEIILFPKASLKALKRPRKKLMRRNARWQRASERSVALEQDHI